jgi:hypothetical protein
MNNKFFAIFTFFAGILCFAIAVATAHGWPSLPTAQAAINVPVIPQDISTNIEVDGELAVAEPTSIDLPEVMILIHKVNPGAARHRSIESVRPLESPQGWASKEALSYQPLSVTSHDYNGHNVRSLRVRATEGSFSQPSRSLKKPEHETYAF